MTMTEPPTSPAPKRKSRPRRKATPRAPKPAAEFAGLTVADCPTACNAERCVISGIGFCAHPRKGGLQARLHNDEALKRLDKAQKMLGKKAIDLRSA